MNKSIRTKLPFYISILTMLVTPVTAFSLENDKVHHIGASTVIASSTQLVTDSVGMSLSVCGSIGLMKDLYDINTTGFSERDLLADAVGCLIGTFATDYGMYLYTDGDATGLGYEIKW